MHKKSLTFSALQTSIRNGSKRYQGIHQFRAGIDLSHFAISYQRLFPHKGSLQRRMADQNFNGMVSTLRSRSGPVLIVTTTPEQNILADS